MRLTILGGGGFRVPLVYRALLGDRGEGRVTDVTLYDLDASRLATIRKVLADQASGHPDPPAVPATTDLDEAVTGADFVFSAIRVGGARRPRGGRTHRAGGRRAGPGDRRRGRHLLRAAHRPGGGRDRPPHRGPGARGLGHQLHQSGRPGHRGDDRPPRGPGDRDLRLTGGPRPPRGRGARRRSGARPPGLRGPEPPGLAARPVRRGPGPAAVPVRGRGHADLLRGGQTLRRRSAAHARRAAQRVPALLLLQPRVGALGGGRRADPGRLPALPATALLRLPGHRRRDPAGVARRLERLGRDPPGARGHLHGREPRDRRHGGTRLLRSGVGRLRTGGPRPDAGHRPGRAGDPHPQRP